MCNLLSVGLFEGIWNSVTGLIKGVGGYLSTNFVPVADTIWNTGIGFIKQIPAFCVAHPGAVVLGVVGTIVGVKVVKGVFGKIKSGIKAISNAFKRKAEAKEIEKALMEATPVKVVTKEKAPAKVPEKTPAKSPAKEKIVVYPPKSTSIPAKSDKTPAFSLADYMDSKGDNLQDYRAYRMQKDHPVPTSTAPILATSNKGYTPSRFFEDEGMTL